MAERRIEMVPPSRLAPYQRNARTHSPEQVAQIAASIVEFGFTNPILVDRDFGIIAGHGRLPRFPVRDCSTLNSDGNGGTKKSRQELRQTRQLMKTMMRCPGAVWAVAAAIEIFSPHK